MIERLKGLSKVIRDYSVKFKENPNEEISWYTLKIIADKLDEILVGGEKG
jgi:hypothetical protein